MPERPRLEDVHYTIRFLIVPRIVDGRVGRGVGFVGATGCLSFRRGAIGGAEESREIRTSMDAEINN